MYVLKLVRNRVLNFCSILSPTQLNTPPHRLPGTHCLFILYFDIGQGGGEPERRLEGQYFTKVGSKIPM